MEKFIALFDIHWGNEINGSRHKVPLHDEKAVNVALEFAADFKPDHIILGGDILDCGSVSHHTKGRTGQLEGLRLLADAEECKSRVIKPLEAIAGKGRLIYHTGNHERWLEDVVDEMPALEGIVDISTLLNLKKWEVIEQGKSSKVGKLTFVHGDTVKGGQNPALAAVTNYERNIRFGHFHTFQMATKTTPVDQNGHTGIAVPCLCKKGPRYGEGAPNKWMQGFLWGYVNGPQGTFNDYVTVIVNGKAIIGGKVYAG